MNPPAETFTKYLIVQPPDIHGEPLTVEQHLDRRLTSSGNPSAFAKSFPVPSGMTPKVTAANPPSDARHPVEHLIQRSVAAGDEDVIVSVFCGLLAGLERISFRDGYHDVQRTCPLPQPPVHHREEVGSRHPCRTSDSRSVSTSSESGHEVGGAIAPAGFSHCAAFWPGL